MSFRCRFRTLQKWVVNIARFSIFIIFLSSPALPSCKTSAKIWVDWSSSYTSAFTWRENVQPQHLPLWSFSSVFSFVNTSLKYWHQVLSAGTTGKNEACVKVKMRHLWLLILFLYFLVCLTLRVREYFLNASSVSKQPDHYISGWWIHFLLQRRIKHQNNTRYPYLFIANLQFFMLPSDFPDWFAMYLLNDFFLLLCVKKHPCRFKWVSKKDHTVNRTPFSSWELNRYFLQIW